MRKLSQWKLKTVFNIFFSFFYVFQEIGKLQRQNISQATPVLTRVERNFKRIE